MWALNWDGNVRPVTQYRWQYYPASGPDYSWHYKNSDIWDTPEINSGSGMPVLVPTTAGDLILCGTLWTTAGYTRTDPFFAELNGILSTAGDSDALTTEIPDAASPDNSYSDPGVVSTLGRIRGKPRTRTKGRDSERID
jgi:hypothetical protein